MYRDVCNLDLLAKKCTTKHFDTFSLWQVVRARIESESS